MDSEPYSMLSANAKRQQSMSTAVRVDPTAEDIVQKYHIEHDIEVSPQENWARILMYTNFTYITATINLGDLIEIINLGGRNSPKSVMIKGLCVGAGCVIGLIAAILSDVFMTKFVLLLSRHVVMFIVSVIAYIDTIYLDKTYLIYCYAIIYFLHTFTISSSIFFLMEYCGKKENEQRSYINAYFLSMLSLLAYGVRIDQFGFSRVSIFIACIAESLISFIITIISRIYIGNVETQDMLVIKILFDFFNCKNKINKTNTVGEISSPISTFYHELDPEVANGKKKFTRIAAAVFPFMFVWAIKYYIKIIWEKEAEYYGFTYIVKYSTLVLGLLYLISFSVVVLIVRPICRIWNLLRTEVHCLAIGYFLIGISIFSSAILFAPVEKIYNKHLQIKGKGSLIYINLLNTSCRVESEKIGSIEIAPESVTSKEIQVNGIHEETVNIFDSIKNQSKIMYIRESAFVFYFISKNGFFKSRGLDPTTSQYCYNKQAFFHIICTKMDNLFIEFSNNNEHKLFNLTNNVTTNSFYISEGVWDIKLTGEKKISVDIEPCGMYGIVIHDKKPLTFNLNKPKEYRRVELVVMIFQLLLWGMGMGFIFPSIIAFIYAESPPSMLATTGAYFVGEVGFGLTFSILLVRAMSYQILRVDMVLYTTTLHYLVFLVFLHFLSRRQV